MNQDPFVSCIMPTANRRGFVPQAIRYFLAQDYPEKELLILDDGNASSADLIPVDPRIRYWRLEQRQSIDLKRYLGCEAARGEILVHWDDDDWMAPQRLRYQVAALRESGRAVCGLRQMLFHDLATSQTWLYDYPAQERTWLADASLAYTRKFYQRLPFPRLKVWLNTYFVGERLWESAVCLPDYSFYVAFVHSANTSPKDFRSAHWKPWFGELRQLLGSDWDFYRALPPA